MGASLVWLPRDLCDLGRGMYGLSGRAREATLAQAIQSETTAAHQRGSKLVVRRALADDWADRLHQRTIKCEPTGAWLILYTLEPHVSI